MSRYRAAAVSGVRGDRGDSFHGDACGVSAVAHFLYSAAATSLSCWDVQFSSVQSCHASPTRPRSETQIAIRTGGCGAACRELPQTAPGGARVRRLSTVPRHRSVLRMPPATDETRRYDMRYDAMNAPQKSFIVDVVRRFGGHRAYVLLVYTCEHNK